MLEERWISWTSWEAAELFQRASETGGCRMGRQTLYEVSQFGRCESLEEGWTDTAELFRRAAAALSLTPAQRKALLKARKHWLRDLERWETIANHASRLLC